MNLSIYGDTHYAWVAAAKLAQTGHKVALCPDLGSNAPQHSMKVSREAMLAELLQQQQQAERLMLECGEAVYRHGDMHFLADDATVAQLERLLDGILLAAERDTFLVVMSPLPIGSAEALHQYARDRLQEYGKPFAVHMAIMPLFIREGSALADFSRPSLFVLGCEDEVMIARMLDVMRPFVRGATHSMVVPLAAAELIKFGINAMLATRISFMNEMAALSERLGVDVELIRQGIAADPRIGADYLQPGCGFGGPSFSDELLSFAHTVKEELDNAGLIEQVLAINESQREILFRKIWRYYRGDLSGRRIAIWGAAFKPGTGSIDNSAVHPLLQALWAQGCKTCVYDPLARDALREHYPSQPLLEYAESAAQAAQDADALAIVTAWDEFWNPDFAALAGVLKTPVVFDGRNMYEPEQMQAHGFQYFAVGRGTPI